MRFPLWRRKEVWWPTWQGWLALLGGGGALVALVLSQAESFLAVSQRVPADILVVEGWISEPAVRSALQEFSQHPYRYVVAVGGWTAATVTPHLGLTYAQYVKGVLVRLGCPTNQLLVALPSPNDTDRTFEQARSTLALLAQRQIRPAGLVVFTEGPHGRRSRLVYQKTFGGRLPVGVISYQPPNTREIPWWQDTVRAKTVIEEALGWLRERVISRPVPQPLASARLLGDTLAAPWNCHVSC